MWKTAVIGVNTGIFIIHTCKISDQSRYAVREMQFERVSLYICSHISRRMDGRGPVRDPSAGALYGRGPELDGQEEPQHLGNE